MLLRYESKCWNLDVVAGAVYSGRIRSRASMGLGRTAWLTNSDMAVLIEFAARSISSSSVLWLEDGRPVQTEG